MAGELLYVDNIGEADGETFVDARCGDLPVSVGMRFAPERGNDSFTVVVSRISTYGRDVKRLGQGMTGRLWLENVHHLPLSAPVTLKAIG